MPVKRKSTTAAPIKKTVKKIEHEFVDRHAIKLNELQNLAFKNILEPDSITLIHGEAGTGKTLSSVYAGFKLLKSKQISRIILTRPTVEVGRSLGFLPGELDEKYGVYLQPFKDFCTLLGNSGIATFDSMVATQQIIPAPLQFMQGMTFGAGDLVIFDEAQNATFEEVKMILTRMGQGSRLAVSGDTAQKMTKRSESPGLKLLLSLSEKLEFITAVELLENKRHPRIRKIIETLEEIHAT